MVGCVQKTFRMSAREFKAPSTKHKDDAKQMKGQSAFFQPNLADRNASRVHGCNASIWICLCTSDKRPDLKKTHFLSFSVGQPTTV